MKILGILIFTSLLSSSAIYADDYLIEEMEKLKSSLDINDPDRAELSLRLADLYFDTSIQEGDNKILVPRREKALSLYTSVLEGKESGEIPKPAKAIVIKFQIARVLNKLGKIHQARMFYQDVFDSEKTVKKMRREASFSLAEYYEEQVNFKQADYYYKKAVGLCESIDSCNLAHYKRAWLHYKELKIDSAITELKLALYEKDGSVREKIINDLLLFFSNRTTNGEDELSFIKELSKKANRDDLVRKLVEAFYSAGNRIAGSTVLMHLNDMQPDPFYEMRLVEEFYGFRDRDLITKYLNQVAKRKINDLPKKEEEAKEFKAMLKRVIVQFDSESESNPAYSGLLLTSIDKYLEFYPLDEMRVKMQQGWLKAQTNKKAKVEKLASWIREEIKLNKDWKYLKKLRQTRLALTQELLETEKTNQYYDIVLTEAVAIEELLSKNEPNSKEIKEFNYLVGYENYRRKNYSKALEKFLPLTVINGELVDKFSLQAQNLVLDIYNQQKKYDLLVKQSNSWVSAPKLSGPKDLQKELKEMSKIKTQASFERVVAMGETIPALMGFYGFCFEKVFEKKSCENAKILAIKLKDQEKLISLLEKENNEEQLMVEYELMGEFSKAAKLQEKFYLTKNAEIPVYLKIALLYEVDANLKERDRILKRLISKIRIDKKMDSKLEPLLYQTFSEAGLINEKTMLLPWELSRKISIANNLENKKSKTVSKILLNSKEYTGPTWSIDRIKTAQSLFQKQAKISFYGRRSKTLFKRRVRKLEKFNEYVKANIQGADQLTRGVLLKLAYQAYQDFGVEIMSTPIPEGLTEEIFMQVQANLTQMSTPYLTVAEDYKKLLDSELALFDDKGIEFNSKTQDLKSDLSALVELKENDQFLVKEKDLLKLKPMTASLMEKPNDHGILSSMKNTLTNSKMKRIAFYFEGRLKNLEASK